MASLATDTPAATPAPADPPGPYRIQAIERAVAILGVFTADEPDLRVSDIAQRLGLHKSTVHRFLVNLEAAGMVEKSARTGRYRLGLRLFELGSLVMQRMNLWDEALPFLEGLVHGTGETGHLAVLEAGEAVYVERVEARRALRVPSAIGRGYPAHATNLGKVLLAHRPAAEVDRQIRALSPFPGAWVEIGGERVKLLRARLAAGEGAPGQVLGGFTIACGDGAVEVMEVQREGRRPMPAAEALRGLVLPGRLG